MLVIYISAMIWGTLTVWVREEPQTDVSEILNNIMLFTMIFGWVGTIYSIITWLSS